MVGPIKPRTAEAMSETFRTARTIHWPSDVPMNSVEVTVTISRSAIDGAPILCIYGARMEETRVMLLPDGEDPIRLVPRGRRSDGD